MSEERPPVCNYDGSDYQASFWERGGREYEDRCEAIALKRLLPKSGRLLLELGAGAGRNTPRYSGFEHVVLLDYSRTQLEQARRRLGRSHRYTCVAADIYRLPFVDGLFDAATMIRVFHHMADAPGALRQIRNAMRPQGTFILEFANKQNLKAILRYVVRQQAWSPFTLEPVEFAALNFDFHPQAVRGWLKEAGFEVGKTLTVSHFRVGWLKKRIPASLLAGLDSIFQWTGALWQVSPSVFVRARAVGQNEISSNAGQENLLFWFKCPECGSTPLEDGKDYLACPGCKRKWARQDGIYDFREEIG